MNVKTHVNAGGLSLNRCETFLARRAPSPKQD